jgi:hypothetical protein
MERDLHFGRPMDRAPESVLVVVEGDAACPMWMGHWGPQPVDGWSMIEREIWETEAAFSERLWNTVARSTSGDATEHHVMLVAGERTDPAAVAARWDTATTILTHLAQHGGGRLVFTVGHGHDSRSEAELCALADELAAEWADSGVEVTVRVPEALRPALRKSSMPPRPSRVPYAREAQLAAH